MTINVISFDLDGTLSQEEYDHFLWNELLPQLYAKRYKIPLEKAKSFVYTEYNELWEATKGEWFDIDFWIYRYDLHHSPEDVLGMIRDKINHYDDVEETLKKLTEKGHELIITTSASKRLVKEKLDVGNLKQYFSRAISIAEDFNSKSKSSEIYKRIIEMLGIKPEEFLHVGDSFGNDYDKPLKAGLNALLIDREDKHPEVEKRISSLAELPEYIEKNF
ncbi:MAG: HAD family hydrolase [Candidatus Woesearchaeota archaeon]